AKSSRRGHDSILLLCFATPFSGTTRNTADYMVARLRFVVQPTERLRHRFVRPYLQNSHATQVERLRCGAIHLRRVALDESVVAADRQRQQTADIGYLDPTLYVFRRRV